VVFAGIEKRRPYKMVLHLLPERTGGAAENMALDFLLLQRYPEATPRFRHYGWRAPAFTFGLSQKLEFIKAQLPAADTFDLCRRPTGGGLVDHREDWTYTLVIPRGHPLEELRATQSYRVTHEALADALRAQGVQAATKQIVEQVPTDAGPAGVCFQRAEIFDVVNEATGEKIAGAAQKRNKQGLLFQGSIWRPAAGAAVDWENFRADFAVRLAQALEVPGEEAPWPEFEEAEVEDLIGRYSSPEWMEAR
jgi:lipoate-protein ligase A